MDTLVHDAVREMVVALAEEYAVAFLAAMPAATSQEELQEALAGTLLTFLAEVAGIAP